MLLIITDHKSIFQAMVVALVCAVYVTLISTPHFVGNVTATIEGNNAVVYWKEVGLGDSQTITYMVTADGVVTYNCGGKECSGTTNTITVRGPVFTTGKFSSGKNGQITRNLILEPLTVKDFSCPPDQALILIDASYSNIQITDQTNNITEAATPATISATFLDCP